MRSAGSRLPEPTSQPGFLLEARSGRCTRQPDHHAKNPTHPCLHRRSTAPAGVFPVVFLSGSSSPGRAGHPATAAAVPAARSPGLDPRAEALGARTQPPPLRGLAGGGGEPGGGERQQEAGDGGARSQSAAQITAQPAGLSAGSRVCSELPPPPLLLAASLLPAPHSSRRRRTAKPLSPLAFLSLSPPPKPLAKRARGREAPASGMTGGLRAPRARERGRARGGGGGAASWPELPARGLEAELILELESSSTSLPGLEGNTNVPSCHG